MTTLTLVRQVKIKTGGAVRLYRQSDKALIDVLVDKDVEPQLITIDRHLPEAESALLTSMDVVQQIQDDPPTAKQRPGRLGPLGRLPRDDGGKRRTG